MAAIKVTLKHGLAGIPASQRAVVTGLGLKKSNSTKVLPDNPCTMGMIRKVGYLLAWERVDAPAPQGRKTRKSKGA
ncbi:MAG: 50S ribosomal protein L30 [Deltaproteobacteria bacterium]